MRLWEHSVISKLTSLEVMRYGLAGIINTAVGLLIYVICVKLFSAPFWIANIFAIIGGLICGYFLSQKFVFTSSTSSLTRAAPRYVFVIALQFAVTTALIGGLISIGQGEISAYLITLPIAIILSFGLQKLWVFKSVNSGLKI